MWLGPAPRVPYCPARCGVNYRWVFDYSGGQLTDWGGHHPDIAQWGMDTETTGPVEGQAAAAIARTRAVLRPRIRAGAGLIRRRSR